MRTYLGDIRVRQYWTLDGIFGILNKHLMKVLRRMHKRTYDTQHSASLTYKVAVMLTSEKVQYIWCEVLKHVNLQPGSTSISQT